MERIGENNRVKLYGVILGIVLALAQHGIYLIGHLLALAIGFEPILPKIPAIDDLIPVVPVFIIPYVWAYLYWAMAPMAASKCSKEHFLDYIAAYIIACLAGMLVLAVAPTYMDRVAEGLYAERSGFFAKLMLFWYSLDGSEVAYNLFPSFHCLNSTMSYLAVCGRKEVPKWFRVYSLVITLVIFASTLFVKQHYFIDILGGVFIAVVVFLICKKCHAGRMFIRPIKYFRAKFGKKENK